MPSKPVRDAESDYAGARRSRDDRFDFPDVERRWLLDLRISDGTRQRRWLRRIDLRQPRKPTVTVVFTADEWDLMTRRRAELLKGGGR